MSKPSFIETLMTDTTEKTYIDYETTQIIIRDIEADMERKVATAEAQVQAPSSNNETR